MKSFLFVFNTAIVILNTYLTKEVNQSLLFCQHVSDPILSIVEYRSVCLLANSDCNLSYIVVETLLVSSLRVVEVFVPLLAML